MRKPVKPGSPVPRSPHPPAAPAGTAAATAATAGAGAGADADATVRQPTARKPGEAAPKRPAPAAPEQDEPPARPGDLICGACGAGNDPARRFCRRCGSSLEAAATVPTPPWWKRIFHRSPKPGTAAGSRPTHLRADAQRRAGRARRWMTTLVVVAGLGALVVWLRPTLSDGVGWARDRISGTELVEPSSITASAQAKGHPAALTTDGNTLTYWAPPAASKPKGQHLDYTFAAPIRLVQLVLVPGAAKDDAATFKAQGRPTSVAVRITTSQGAPVVKQWELSGEMGAQALTVGIDDVTAVRVTIRDSVAGSQGRLVAVAEAEFHAR